MIKPANALTSALAGLNRANERYANSADQISKGSIDPGTIVDAKVNAQDVKLQLKNLSLAMDQEKELLDLLA